MLKTILSRKSFQHHIQKDRAEVARGYFQRTPNKYRNKIQTWLLTAWEMPTPSWISASRESERPPSLISEQIYSTGGVGCEQTAEQGPSSAFHQRPGIDNIKVHLAFSKSLFCRSWLVSYPVFFPMPLTFLSFNSTHSLWSFSFIPGA